MAERRPIQADSVDAYLAHLPDDQRAALERLRRDIHAAVPGLEECISYRMPAFRLNGKVLVWFGAASKHCAFYPGGVVEPFKDELAGYGTSKGTIRFRPDQPLPPALVKRMIEARIAAIAAKSGR